MDDARSFATPAMVAGAFDAFGNARAAAEDLLSSGFARRGVSVASNPSNPDGVPGSIAGEIAAAPGICRRLFASLVAGERSRRVRDDVRRGGVVVSVPVSGEAERALATNILRLHWGLDVEYAGPGVPLY